MLIVVTWCGVGIAHWKIGMDGAAVSLEDNRGINIKEERMFRLFGRKRRE